MKRNPTLRAAVALLLAAGALSCSKDPIPEPGAPEAPEHPAGYVSFVAGTPEAEPDASAAPASRAGYDSATGHAVWEEGDRIGIFVKGDHGNANLLFTQKAGTLSADRRTVEYEGTFANPLSGTQTVCALYPYDSQARLYISTTINTTFPGRQLYSPDGYTGIPLYGKYEGDIADLQFKNFFNPFALIELRLSSDEPVRVTRIVFQGNNDEQVSGPIQVDLSGSHPAVTLDDYQASKSIVLDCGEGVALSTAPTSFYIAIPVQAYPKGYRFDIRTDRSGANGIVLKAKSGGVTPAANTIVVTPARTLAAAELKKIIPDKAFRTWLAQNGWVTVDDEASGAVTVLDTTTETMNCSYQTIASLEGIEYFPQLTALDCTGNRLSTLDISANTLLTTLNCADNRLSTLDISAHTALTSLDCTGNRLSTLDISANTLLTSLNCGGNQLTTLDIKANSLLTALDCNQNQFTTLDLTANIALTSLNCSGNQITTLDLTANTRLSTLNCNNNKLNSLTLPQSASLSTLNCAHNQLTALDVSVLTQLKTLDCTYNQLTSLTLPATASLTELNCSTNQLTELDVSALTQLKTLYCSDNLLTTLGISHNTALNKLYCLRNRLTTLDATSMTKPTYYLYCGKQRDAAGQNVTLQLTLKETQRTQWEGTLSKDYSNKDSVTATFVP